MGASRASRAVLEWARGGRGCLHRRPPHASEGDSEAVRARWQRPRDLLPQHLQWQGAVPRPALVTGCKVPAPGDPRQSAPPDRLALDFGATRMLWQLPSLLKLLRVARGSPPQQSFEGH